MISYLQIENITKAFGDLVLFENITFQLGKNQKVALVAKNGAGKTTLFNILCGNDSPDSGSVKFYKEISIGFLEQEPSYNENLTVTEQVFLSSGELLQIVEEYENSLISEDKNRIQNATEKMDAFAAWDFEAKIKQILGKLKIEDFNKKMGTLSSGERKRVALANALIKEPDLLILDEPTNHLDLEMIEWLEDYLTRSGLTLFMVTHDRYFLDRICNEIIEIDDKQIYTYSGNYTSFLEKREERLMNDQVNTEKARNLYRKELEWIRRQPKARTTKSKSRIDTFYDIEEKAAGKRIEKSVKLNVQGKRLGSKIIEVKNLSKSFGNQKIITNFTYNFARFEKIGIVGNNGTGKTTFLNLITEEISPDSGTIEVGETVHYGYYKQDGMNFNNQIKVIDAACEIAEVISLGNGAVLTASQFLNYFLFPPEKQQSYIYKLSGGEKRRLYLATILMRNPNFLILDEPTNDLDILTLNVLEEYLQNFNGCVIIVSHDRYFMDKVVDHLFAFEGNNIIKDFPGNYSQYRHYGEKQLIQKKSADKSEKKTRPDLNIVEKNNVRKATYKEKKEFGQLTIEIDLLEKEYKQIETDLGSGILNNNEVLEKSNRLGDIIIILDTKTNLWLELSDIIEG